MMIHGNKSRIEYTIFQGIGVLEKKINSSFSFFPLKDMQTGLWIIQSILIYNTGSHAQFVKHKVKVEVQC